MWHSVIPNVANIHNITAINWKTKLDPFQQHINETVRWYEALINFNQILASQDVQLQSEEFVQIYGVRNPNRSDLLTPMNSVYVKGGHIVQNGIHELSFGLNDCRISLINDIWDYNMQPATLKYDSETRTWKAHGFILKMSHIMGYINSHNYSYDTLELFAIDRIFDDDVIIYLYPKMNLIVLASVYKVVPKSSINVSGKNGENNLPANPGHGYPDRAGQPAENFLGDGFEIKNSNMLKISAIDGDGQNGLKGVDGINGVKESGGQQGVNMFAMFWTGMPGGSNIRRNNIVINYKFFLRASLIENGKHKNIRQLKKLHEHMNQVWSTTYEVNDFVEELINLETQCQQLNKIDCIEFYESLLGLVHKFAGDGSPNTNRTLNCLTTAIFTKIHNYRSGFDDYIVIDIKEYLKHIVENIKGSFKQLRLTLATANYQNLINARIDEARSFLTSLGGDVDMRLEEMKVNIKSSKSELVDLKEQTHVSIDELKRQQHKLEGQRKKLNILQGFFGIIFAVFPFVGVDIATKVGEMFIGFEKDTIEKKINAIEAELNNNEELLDRVIKNEEIFNSMITPLFTNLKNAMDGTNLIDPNQSQIGSEITGYTLKNLFIEFEHYFKQISSETDSVEEVRLSINKLQYALQTLLDINGQIHIYKQQSELSGYLNEIASDSLPTDDPILTQLENFIKMNLICTEYKAAIRAVTSFAFPFADTYLADLEPRNLCDLNTLSSTSTHMLEIATNQITQLSNRISKADQTVSNMLDKHIYTNTYFRNGSVIGPFYEWSNADNRNAIHRLLAGNEVIFVADVTKTKNWRMAVKLNEIGIDIRTHADDMQTELDYILNDYGLTMKHLGPSCFRWHDEFYTIPSDTSVVIRKSFQECPMRRNECFSNEASEKLKNGDPVLSPYTMWALKLNNEKTGSMEFDNNLQRFADQVDIVLEGKGSYVDADIELDQDILNKYYRKCNIVN